MVSVHTNAVMCSSTNCHTGDHDLDGDNQQVSVFSGRGIFSESAGPVWLIGTGAFNYTIQSLHVSAHVGN